MLGLERASYEHGSCFPPEPIIHSRSAIRVREFGLTINDYSEQTSRMQSSKSALIGLIGALLIGCSFSVSSAWAGYTVTLLQQGANVVATGSGALDLTGLNFNGTGSTSASMFPSIGALTTGPAVPNSAMFDDYNVNGGPVNFGSGGFTDADNGNGDIVGIIGVNGGQIVVPHGYVSGTALSDTSIYDSATFSSLGVTPGTYEWTWGMGENQNFTLDAVVPEPGTLSLLILGALGLVATLRKRLLV